MKLPRRRRRPRTRIGNLIRAWPWIRLGLRAMRVGLRVRRAIIVAVFAGLGAALFKAARRRRNGARSAHGVPPASNPGWGGGTRESGYEAGPGTQTERRLEDVKDEPPDSA